MGLLQQSTARNITFLMVASSDHLSALTGATVTVTLSKNGGAFGAAGGTVTEISSGWYSIALTTTDTNTLGDLAIHCTATSGDPTDFKEQVVAFSPTDSAALGLSRIDAAITSRMATFTLPTNFSSLAIDGSGRVTVGSIVNGAIAAATFAANALGAVWDELRASHTTANTFGQGVASVQGAVTGSVASVTGNVGGNVTGSVGSVAAGGITASSIAADAIGASELAADAVAEIADQVWDEILSGHAVVGSTGAALSAAGGSGDPWATALPGSYGAGTAGAIVGALPSASAIATAVWGAGTRTLTSLSSLLSSIAGAIWDEARASHTTSGTFGQGVASVQGNVTGSAASVTGAVGSVTGAVGSVTGNVGGNVVGSVASVTAGVMVTTNNDKTGYRLSATGVDDVFDEALSGHTTAGTAGKALSDAAAGTGGGGGASAADVWAYATRTLTSSSGGTVGSGSIAYPVTVTRPDGVTPIEGVAVWVSTDSAGTHVVAGTEYTDALGRINGAVGFMLDSGNYYLWRQHGQWAFPNPTAFTVS